MIIDAPDGDLTDEQLIEIRRGFATEHIHRGWYDQGDLDALGITSDEADAFIRERDRERMKDRTVRYVKSLPAEQQASFVRQILAELNLPNPL